MSVASLSPPTPYTALMSLLSVALSSVTAKSNFMIPPELCCVNIQPVRKPCSISPESVLIFSGIDAQLRRFCRSISAAYAIDLDHCIDEDGNYSQTAAEIIAMMYSYTELSPSGAGVHILFRAEDFHYDTNRYYIMNRQTGIEIYVAGATNKYVTITGQSCAEHPFGDRSSELQQVLERFMVRERITATNAINAGNSEMTIDQLLEKAFSSRRGDAIKRLWAEISPVIPPTRKQIRPYVVTWPSGQDETPG